MVVGQFLSLYSLFQRSFFYYLFSVVGEPMVKQLFEHFTICDSPLKDGRDINFSKR